MQEVGTLPDEKTGTFVREKSFFFSKSSRVLMKAATWTRESHGLFDYESQHISKRNLKASSSVKIVRIKNDIHLINNLVNEKKLINENSKVLGCLKKIEGN